jgi:3-methyladenine DNA glycosylase AlkD
LRPYARRFVLNFRRKRQCTFSLCIRLCNRTQRFVEARRKKTTPERRKELYDLYLRRHDRINNWDLVDVCAIHVIGGYLADKPRGVLYKLGKSKNMWERRTAIVSTAYFIRQRDLDNTFKIAEMLLNDKEDLVHKATGWMLRFAGDKDRARLLSFLDKHAATMPRVMLRYAIEKFDKKQRDHYLSLKTRLRGKHGLDRFF